MTRRIWMESGIVFIATGIVAGATQKSIVEGRWDGKLHSANGDATMTFAFKVKGHLLTGTAEMPAGSQAISNGKVDGAKISFDTTVNGNLIQHEGMVNGDKIQLHNVGPFGKFDVTLERVSSEKASAQ